MTVKNHPIAAALAVFAPIVFLPALPAYAAEDVSAPQVVDAIEGAFGVTPGARRNHIKGTCATGRFVGTPEAARYSQSALFTGEAIPVVARFSLSGGNPKAPDTAKSGRGMALEFKLPGGQLHHITMLNTPMFGAAHPQTFLDLMLAMRPDPATGKPDPGRLKAFARATLMRLRSRSISAATTRPRATPTARSGAFTPSSSSTKITKSPWCAGSSSHKTVRNA